MNNTLKYILIVGVILIFAGILVTAGFLLGRAQGVVLPLRDNRLSFQQQPFFAGGCRVKSISGWSSKVLYGLRRSFAVDRHGMMPWRNANPADDTAEPIPMQEARALFEDFLTRWGDDNLKLSEVMLFEKNGYAIVVESDSNMGAFELLLDYQSGEVFPEFGPTRMWNLKYGMMGRGMMRWNWAPATENLTADSFQMPISEPKARDIAQSFLNKNISDAKIATEGVAFYGYYTFDYQQNDQISGMISVNAFNGQIWPHTWHGKFLEEWEVGE